MNERIIDLIKKLIRVERSVRKNAGTTGLYGTSTAEEAAAFAVKVQQLCIDHKIAAEQINIDDGETAKQRVNHEKFYTSRTARVGYGAYVKGEDSRLMHIVSKAHFCKALTMAQSNVILLVGEDQDRAVCVEMFEYLRHAMRVGAIRAEEEQRRRRRTVRRFRYWFCLGFVNIVEKRYTELREVNNCTALVKADALVLRYIHENFKTTKTRDYRAPGRMNLEAALAGMRHGHAVSLSGKVVN